MLEFDQREFYPTVDFENNRHFKNRETGYLYIPNQCEGDGSVDCRVHFVLHGCGGSPTYMQNKGYEDYAITNNIIVVWPSTRCWDMFGQISQDDSYKTNDSIVHRAFN